MTDIEGISPRTPRPKQSSPLRLLIKGGVHTSRVKDGIEYRLHYIDGIDLPEIARQAISQAIRSEREKFPWQQGPTSKEVKIGRRFAIYTYINDKNLSVLTHTEILNSRFGYEYGDFLIQNYAFPEYRHTDFDRWPAEDFEYLLCTTASGIMKRRYAVLTINQEDRNNFSKYLDGKVNNCYPGTSPDSFLGKWPHISAKRIVDGPNGKLVILEFDAQKYVQMNLHPEGFERLDVYVEKIKAETLKER